MVVFISAASEIEAQSSLVVTAKIDVTNIAVDGTAKVVDTGIEVSAGDIIKFAVNGEFRFNADKPLTEDKRVHSVAFSPDGTTLASSSFFTIKLWRIQ